MHSDDIELIREAIEEKRVNSPYGRGLPIAWSAINQAINELESKTGIEFTLRQEVRVLTKMNESKAREIEKLNAWIDRLKAKLAIAESLANACFEHISGECTCEKEAICKWHSTGQHIIPLAEEVVNSIRMPKSETRP